MLTNLKHSLLTAGATSLLSFGTFAVASPTYAASIDLSSWTSIGDASTTSTTATINSGTDNTAFTGGGADSVEDFLGITPASLANAIPNNQYGSAIKNTLGVNAGDVFSFNWNFATTDADKAFVTINNAVTQLKGTSPFTYSFATAGNYNIGLGVVDVDDSIGTSTLTVSNAKIQSVPEPVSIFGSVVALGFGVQLRKRFGKKAAV
jgi:hypothetical protein